MDIKTDPERDITSPGDLIREDVLPSLGVTAAELAQHLMIPAYRLNDVLRDRTGVDAYLALRLSRVVGSTPEFWMRLQMAHDLRKARKQVGENLDRVLIPLEVKR